MCEKDRDLSTKWFDSRVIGTSTPRSLVCGEGKHYNAGKGGKHLVHVWSFVNSRARIASQELHTGRGMSMGGGVMWWGSGWVAANLAKEKV